MCEKPMMGTSPEHYPECEYRDATWIWARRAEKAESILAQITAIHDEWGAAAPSTIDQVDLWERIGRAIRGPQPPCPTCASDRGHCGEGGEDCKRWDEH